MNKKKETAAVFRQRQLAEGIYDMWIKTDLAKEAKPGQFLMVYPRGAATLLPRPISICEVRSDENRLRIVYRVAGKGTAEFASYQEGEPVSVMGTLGNGFPFEEAAGKRVFLMGGGIGIPPMLGLAQALAGNRQAAGGESTDAAKESGQAADGESTDAAKESGQAAADSTDTKKTDGLTEPVSVHAVLGYRDSALFLKVPQFR